MVEFIPARKRQGTVSGLFAANGQGFVTEPVAELVLTYEGIPGDAHAGQTRTSGSREPWYPRGTKIANERQVSILSSEELGAVASDMGLAELKSEWIGGNLTLEGIPHLSLLPPRTLLLFEGGATIRIDGDNGPCRIAGKSIAEAAGNPDAELGFPKHARHRRGLVGWVEKPGTVRVGEAVTARIWEQWIYPD